VTAAGGQLLRQYAETVRRCWDGEWDAGYVSGYDTAAATRSPCVCIASGDATDCCILLLLYDRPTEGARFTMQYVRPSVRHVRYSSPFFITFLRWTNLQPSGVTFPGDSVHQKLLKSVHV